MNNLPPQNIEIESSCLACTLLNKSACLKVLSETFEEDYYLDKHRILFNAIKTVNKDGEVDIILLKDYLIKEKLLDTIGGVDTLLQLNATSSANLGQYIQQLKHYSKLRKIIQLSTESMDGAYGKENPQEIISKISNQIKNINLEQSKKVLKLSEVMGSSYKDIQLDWKSCINTGLEKLDEEVLILPDDLIILAARPSMGKTSLALNIAKNVSKKDPVLFFSLEQSNIDISIRLLCSETNIAFKKIKLANRLDEWETDSINKAYKEMKNLELYVFDQPARASEIINTARVIIDICKPKLIITDYLQLIIPEDKKIQRHLQIQEITRSFKNFAKEVRIPHMLLCQLSRASEIRKDRRPILSDLRESGDIEQDGDKIIFIYREKLDEPLTDLIIAKYRNGQTGVIEADFNGRAMQFS